MKLLIVGQAPSSETDGLPPLSGRSGRRLAKIAGHSRVSDFAEADNLLPRWLGHASGKGDCAEPRICSG